MSSSMFPGSIPLPVDPSAQSNGASAAAIPVPVQASYDPQAQAIAMQALYSTGYYQHQQQQEQAAATAAAYQYDYYGTVAAAASNYVAQRAHQNHQPVDGGGDGEEDDDDDPTIDRGQVTKANVLPIWGNEKTMNLNPLVLTNIQSSPYFKQTLYALKTYHEVIDEIWYNVKHLEPWEPGSRKTAGQTGMCGSVRGVGAGGIISTPFCILFKFFTLKLTRKQLNGLLRHKDSAFIRGIGFLYIRFTQPPESLWSWYEKFLDDEEEVQPSATGGPSMTIAGMCRQMLTKLDWFGTRFPRIPVPVQKTINEHLDEYDAELRAANGMDNRRDDRERGPRNGKRSADRDTERHTSKDKKRDDRDDNRRRERRSRSRDRDRRDDRHRRRSRSPDREHRRRSRSKDRDRRRDDRRDRRSRSRERRKYR